MPSLDNLASEEGPTPATTQCLAGGTLSSWEYYIYQKSCYS
jgi:hypothetical protein